MRQKLEQNGKPCCLNLITEADNRFLKNIERQAKREAREAEDASKPADQTRSQAELEIMENPNLTEEERQQLLAAEEAKKQQDSDSEVDEIEAMIEREEIEARRAEAEAAERKLFEEDAEKDRKMKEQRDAAKLE